MKNTILLILLIIAALVIGSLIGTATAEMNGLDWLAYALEVGIDPTPINLIIIKLNFGFQFSMNIAQIIFLIVAVAVYPKLKKLIAG